MPPSPKRLRGHRHLIRQIHAQHPQLRLHGQKQGRHDAAAEAQVQDLRAGPSAGWLDGS